MVLSPAPSAFWRKSRLPLSSTMQMVTCTFRLCASASAAAAIVLMAARFSHFLLGSSAAQARVTEVRSRIRSVCMPIMVTASSWPGEMREWLLPGPMSNMKIHPIVGLIFGAAISLAQDQNPKLVNLGRLSIARVYESGVNTQDQFYG